MEEQAGLGITQGASTIQYCDLVSAQALSTVASSFRAIRAVLYRAIREGLCPQAENPFFQFKLKEGKTSRAKLSLEDVQAIEGLDLEGGSLIWHTRNYFQFSFYCAGVRFGDLAKMRRDVYLISKALGHSSIKVTEAYLRGFDAEALDAEMDNLFSNV